MAQVFPYYECFLPKEDYREYLEECPYCGFKTLYSIESSSLDKNRVKSIVESYGNEVNSEPFSVAAVFFMAEKNYHDAALLYTYQALSMADENKKREFYMLAAIALEKHISNLSHHSPEMNFLQTDLYRRAQMFSSAIRNINESSSSDRIALYGTLRLIEHQLCTQENSNEFIYEELLRSTKLGKRESVPTEHM